MTAEGYFEHARVELLDLFARAPRRLLDVGCGAGATSALIKAQWPGATAIGLEVVPQAAEQARARVDRVICASAETVDFAREAIDTIDTVVLADVLEHLVDPWSFLRRLKPVLTPDAMLIVSIPNAANLWLIEELANGRFDYTDEGLLDRTHLRFFTRASIARMFAETGYRIEALKRIDDGRVDDITMHRLLGIMLPRRPLGSLRGRRVTVHGVDDDAYEDLRTSQFAIRATPA